MHRSSLVFSLLLSVSIILSFNNSIIAQGGETVPPSGWICSIYQYSDGYSCDGGCGVLDPDCSLFSDPYVYNNCPSGQMVNPLDITQCIEKVVPAGWVCDIYQYADGWSCDGGCGALDSDCLSSTDPNYYNNCPSGQNVNPLDIAQCIEIVVPTGWICGIYQYGDGWFCDGGCGALDSDCSSLTDPYYYNNCPYGQMVDPENIIACIPEIQLQSCYCDADGDFMYRDLAGYNDSISALDCSTYSDAQCSAGSWVPQSVIKGLDCNDDDSRVLNAYSQYLDIDGDKYYNTTYSSLTCDEYPLVDSSKLILSTQYLGADCIDTDTRVLSSGKQYLDLDSDKYYNTNYGSLDCSEHPLVDSSKLILTTQGLGVDCIDTDALVLNAYSQYLDLDGDKYYNTTYSSLSCSEYPLVDSSKLILTSQGLGSDCLDTNFYARSSSYPWYYDGDGDKYYNASTRYNACAGDVIPLGFNIINWNTSNMLTGLDCNDNNASVFGDSTHYLDRDGDRYYESTFGTISCIDYSQIDTSFLILRSQGLGVDCDDGNSAQNIGGINHRYDGDGDGQYDPAIPARIFCPVNVPTGWVSVWSGADNNDQLYDLGDISSCGTYSGSNGEYYLTSDIRIANDFNGSCIIFTGSNISFDMNNLRIYMSDNYSYTSAVVNGKLVYYDDPTPPWWADNRTINAIEFSGVGSGSAKIKDGQIYQVTTAIRLNTVANLVVTNIQAYNTDHAIGASSIGSFDLSVVKSYSAKGDFMVAGAPVDLLCTNCTLLSKQDTSSHPAKHINGEGTYQYIRSGMDVRDLYRYGGACVWGTLYGGCTVGCVTSDMYNLRGVLDVSLTRTPYRNFDSGTVSNIWNGSYFKSGTTIHEKYAPKYDWPTEYLGTDYKFDIRSIFCGPPAYDYCISDKLEAGYSQNAAERWCKSITSSNSCFAKVSLDDNPGWFYELSDPILDDLTEHNVIDSQLYLYPPDYPWTRNSYITHHRQFDTTLGSIHPYSSYYMDRNDLTNYVDNAGTYIRDKQYLFQEKGSKSVVQLRSSSPGAISGLTNLTDYFAIDGSYRAVSKGGTKYFNNRSEFREVCHPMESASLDYDLDFSSISPCPYGYTQDCEGTCHPPSINTSSLLFKKYDVCGICGGGATSLNECTSLCGAAAGVITSTPPSSNLCTDNSKPPVFDQGETFGWLCGSGAQRDLCSAPKPLCLPGEVRGCDNICRPPGQEYVIDCTGVCVDPALALKEDVCGICGGGETDINKCCPIGTTWDPLTNTCAPISCPAGTTYVQNSLKPDKCCTAAEVTANTSQCGNTSVCDYDGICDDDEGCLCPDCTDKPDHCAPGLACGGTVIPGVGGAACCPTDTTWNPVSSTCVQNSIPNLTASAPTPNTAILNTPQTFTSTITNNGTASTNAGFNNFFQVATAAGGGGTITNTTASPMIALDVGATRDTTMNHTFTTAGTYSIRACADKNTALDAGTITESNEGDNCSGWTDVAVGYTIFYNANGATSGTAPTQQIKYQDTPLTLATNSGNLTKTDYTFIGWNTQADGTGTHYTTGASYTANASMTLYAQWASSITLCVTADSPYNVDPGATMSFKYTLCPTTDPDTECQLVNFNKTSALSAYAYSNPIPGTAPMLDGVYSYYIRCRDTTYPDMIAYSNQIFVLVGDQPLPDLVAGLPTPSSLFININTPQEFTTSVTSHDAPTYASFNSIFQIATASIETNPASIIDTIEGTIIDAPIAAGESKDTIGEYTFTTPGTYYIRTCTDNDLSWVSQVDESNELNNCGEEISITVSDVYSVTYHSNYGTDVTIVDGIGYSPGSSVFLAPANTFSNGTQKLTQWCVTPDCSGANDGYTPAEEYKNIAGNLDFYAQWGTGNYTLTVNKTGQGIITSNPGTFKCDIGQPTCIFTYPPSTLVTLTATTPPTNPKTVYWSASECDRITGDNKEICTITLDQDKQFSLIFLGSLDGCFADSTSAVNLGNYTPGLTKRINGVPPTVSRNIGYLFTDPTRVGQRKTLSTKLAGNINKYITSRYCPRSIPALWNAADNQAAPIKPLTGGCIATSKPNPNGYFYYRGDGETMTISGLSGTDSAKNDEIRQPTVLYVVGGDIYIKENIRYSQGNEDTPSLVIIVQRDFDKLGNSFGGNIYVDPSVTHIDATLIADGALMNAAIALKNGEKTLEIHNWILHPETLWKRLVINGRLLIHNTRGGSLKSESGVLLPIHDGTNQNPIPGGSCATEISFGYLNCPWYSAAAQDLERFRMVETEGGNTQCSLYVTDNIPARKPDILTTVLEGY